MVDLDELERLEREATPGPWELEERMRGYGIFAGRFQDFGRGPQRVHGLNLGHVSDLDANGEDNLALIIAARNALPDLLAELRTLRARVAELERDARLVSETRAAWKDLDPVVRETTTGAFRVGLAAVRHFEAEEATEALRAEEGSDQ